LSEVRLKKASPSIRHCDVSRKNWDREGTLREARNRRNYEKPSEKRRRKAKEPKLNYWGSFPSDSLLRDDNLKSGLDLRQTGFFFPAGNRRVLGDGCPAL